MLIEFYGLYFDPQDVTDINPGNGCIWINRRGLRGLRVGCQPGEEAICADEAGAAVNDHLSADPE